MSTVVKEAALRKWILAEMSKMSRIPPDRE